MNLNFWDEYTIYKTCYRNTAQREERIEKLASTERQQSWLTGLVWQMFWF